MLLEIEGGEAVQLLTVLLRLLLLLRCSRRHDGSCQAGPVRRCRELLMLLLLLYKGPSLLGLGGRGCSCRINLGPHGRG